MLLLLFMMQLMQIFLLKFMNVASICNQLLQPILVALMSFFLFLLFAFAIMVKSFNLCFNIILCKLLPTFNVLFLLLDWLILHNMRPRRNMSSSSTPVSTELKRSSPCLDHGRHGLKSKDVLLILSLFQNKNAKTSDFEKLDYDFT